MFPSHTLTRTLAATLAAAALAAPAAVARPADLRPPDTKDAATRAAPRQDLRMPDTKDAATRAAPRQDLRMPDTKDAATLLPGPATSPSHPRVVKAAEPPADGGGGSPWTTIGLGLAGACLVVGGTAGIASRTRRRTARARVAA